MIQKVLIPNCDGKVENNLTNRSNDESVQTMRKQVYKKSSKSMDDFFCSKLLEYIYDYNPLLFSYKPANSSKNLVLSILS